MASKPTNKKPILEPGSFLVLAAVLALAVQWIVLRFTGHLPLPWVPILPGIAIFAAAYLLSWAADVSQVDIPPALALALLALVAVLPEYAVDIYFAWTAGKDPGYIPFAAANMTGSNRLLIGLGWPSIVFVYGWRTKRSGVVLDKRLGLEISVLLAATLYAFLIPWKRTLSLWDTLVFLALFAWYFTRVVKGEVEEPELEEGPSEMIASWPPAVRRLAALGLFSVATVTIFLAAAPFAEGLLQVGRTWGVDQFILVQWLAPLASEAPEFIVAILFARRALATASFNTLLSSKVNQWTLLVGMLPLAFALSAHGLAPMRLDNQQAEEIFLTAAQSLFAVILLSDFEFSLWDGFWLFTLFILQAGYPLVEKAVGIDSVHVRYGFAWGYLGLSLLFLAISRKRRENLAQLGRILIRRND